jgi:hypothetical protein
MSDNEVPTDSNGDKETPLHGAVRAAVENAGDNKPDSADTQGGTAAEASDDGESDSDSGDDVDESSSKDDDAPKSVGNIFSRYASTPDARNAAEQFTPNRFDSPGGNTTHPNAFGERLSGSNSRHDATSDVVRPDDAVRIVGGSGASIDARQEQAALQAISDRRAAHGGGGVDLSAEIATHDAVLAPVLNVRAAAPVLIPLMPLAKVPTPQQ